MIIPSIEGQEFDVPPTLTQGQCREWVADLRSGKFKQGREALKNDDYYCCLGVYAETHGGITGSLFRAWISTDRTPMLGILRASSGGLSEHAVERILARANDLDGATFPEIADWIERELLPRCAP